MAQKVQVILTDDVDGGEATETISFALDGAWYEIDLNAQNAERLRESVAEFVRNARKIVGTAKRPVPLHRVESSYDPKAVRAWAAAHKIDVPTRGRIPLAVVEQYHAAGN